MNKHVNFKWVFEKNSQSWEEKYVFDFHTQVGSFNYDNTKMVYTTDFLPKLPNSTDPILAYDVSQLDLFHR